MLMMDIANYIQLNGRASLLDLSRHFHVEESAVQQMLTLWIKKGKVKYWDADAANCTTGKKCSDCFECNDSAHQIYIWVNNST